MKYVRIFAFLVAFNAVPADVGAVGLSAGDVFSATPLAGDLTVRCNDGGQQNTAYYACYEEILEPVDTSYFLGPEGESASRAELTANYENGETRTMDLRYNAATGRSEAVNLWLSSLFQRPLLSYGANRISFSMRNEADAELSRGEFLAQVNIGARRRCRARTYWSSSMSDCRSPGFACSRFFRDENYCR